MNRGFIVKAALEMWPVTLLCGLLLFFVEAVLAYVLPTFEEQFANGVMQIRFVQTFVSAMLGIESTGDIGAEMLISFPWVHPVVLALVWTHALICCTRMPAGEIDRGTIDVLLTLPVTRWTVLRSETLVWLASGAVLIALGWLGNQVGNHFVKDVSPPPPARMFLVLLNMYCMYVTVGCGAWLASALSDKRGPAITIVFLVLLGSFLLNFLAQFWSVADRLSFLGLLDYYRPLFIFRDGTVPWSNLAVLFGVSGLLWTAAGTVFSRRDICTV